MASIVAALSMVAAAPATPPASAPPSPWDGSNPFHCTIQNAGTGASVPDPGADPYCVHFDKTHQNVLQGGLVDFLRNEPARTAAAVPKCFYFQEDHWRGSIAQGDATALYEFTGHYFFNKATGDGGAWVSGFTVAGQTFDPTALPGFPPAYGRYFGPGTGGVITHDDVPADARCAALAAEDPAAIYAQPQLSAPRCVPAAGHIDRHGIGPVTLGMREDRLRALIGAPQQVKRGFLRYCVVHGGALLVGQPGDRSGTLGSGGRAPTVLLLTTSHAFGLGSRTSVGERSGRLRHWRLLGRARGLRLLRAGNLLAIVHRRRIVALGAYDRRALRTRRALLSMLGHAG